MPRLAPSSVSAPNRLRRTLLLGLPGGLALASPLALVGCGGGGGDAGIDPQAASDARVQAIRERLPEAQRVAAKVAVVLPAGAGVAPETTQLVTTNNVARVAADGTSGAVVLDGGAQMAYLFDAAGRLLLIGIVDAAAENRLDARSSAEALVLLASQVTLLGDAPALALRRTLRTHALVEPVQRAVEAAAVRGGIDPDDTALMAALDGALRTLFPRAATAAARARPLAVQVAPTAPQSGVVVEALPDQYNTVQLGNTFRRRTHVWIARTGQLDAGGAFTPLSPPVPLTDFALDATPALSFDSFVAAVGDFVAELAESIGALDPYDAGTAPWSPVRSAPLVLPVLPTDASGTRYAARVLGVGATAGGTLSAAEAAALDTLWGQTFYYDVVVPLVKTLILPLIGEGVASSSLSTIQRFGTNLLLSGALDLTSIEVANQVLPNTVAALKAGDAGSVIQTFFFEFLGSNTFQTLLAELYTALVQSADPRVVLGSTDLRDAQGGLVGVNVLDDLSLVRRNIDRLQAAATKLARIVAIAKALATGADWAAMAKDWAASTRLVEFTLDASAARVRLDPSPVVVDATAGALGKGAITATLEGLDAGLSPDNVFLQWRCTHRYGSLFKRGGDGTDDFESLLSNPTHDYIADGTADDPAQPDSVSVTAYYRDPTSNARVELGSATAQIEFRKKFSLRLNPPGPLDVPTDTDFGLTASFRENVPNGSTVAWEWSSSGVGALVPGAADANPANSRATFRPGSAEGPATVTVRATITVPAGYGVPQTVVVCNPVSATLNVRKGLRTLTFAGSWTTDTTYEPYVCAQCGPGGSPTNETGYSVVAYVVVPKIAGAKGYSVLLEKPTPDVRGGVPFPSTRSFSPSSLSGWSDQGGSYWSGLSGGSGTVNRETGGGPDGFYAWMNGRFGDMKVTVTVTL